MSYDIKCEYCEKEVDVDPKKLGKTWDVRQVYTGWPVPEPSHDVFWHIDCHKDRSVKKLNNKRG